MKRFLLLMAMVLVGITAEAQLVRSATLTVTREELPPVELGWKHIIDAQVGLNIYHDELVGGLHYIAGYRLTQNLLAGAGVGINFSDRGFADDWWYHEDYEIAYDGNPKSAFSLYLHGRYFFSTNEWAPYVGVSAGANLAKKSKINKITYAVDENGNKTWEIIDRRHHKDVSSSSVYIDLNVGLNHRLASNLNNELSIYAGLKFWGKPCYEGGRYEVGLGESNIIANKDLANAICIYLGTSFAF